MATTTPFPRVRGRRFGYDVEEVEDFLAAARSAYDDKRTNPGVSAADIRRTAFSMQRGGYVTAAVDAALERLEDAFATRERDRVMRGWRGAGVLRGGAHAREGDHRAHGPAGRPPLRTGRRPRRSATGRRTWTASPSRCAPTSRRAHRSRSSEVRAVAFRPAHRGYREAQVDLLIDGLIEVMLAVR